MLRIVPTHPVVSRRFPVVSFAIEAPPHRPLEVVCATSPELYSGAARALRRDGNFYTSRRRGWLLAPFGRTRWLLPAEALAAFLQARRIYYVLAAYDSLRAEHGVFSVAAGDLSSVPWVRVAGDHPGGSRWRAPASGERAGGAALAWGGDGVFARALDSDSSDSGDGFNIDDASDGSHGGPATPDAKLAEGQVVRLEVRDAAGAVTRYSHDYPIDLDGNLRLPTAGAVPAKDLSLVDLRANLGAAFGRIVSGASVNVTPSPATVSYNDPLARSDRLYIRVLDPQGNIDPSSGAYAIDSQAKLHLPRVGDVDTTDLTVGQLEVALESTIGQRFLHGAVVNVSKTELP
jgi:protein involved in polysaccharide export with SLBB domain